MSRPSVVDQLNDHIHNKRWFTARWLSTLSRSTGWPPDTLTKALAIIVVVYCCGSENAHYMANFILIAFPIIVLYGFPNEAPNKDVLLVYWSFFGLLSIFDRLLEKIPAYYVFKIVMLLLLFVQQFKLGDSIHEQLSSIRQRLKPRNEPHGQGGPSRPATAGTTTATSVFRQNTSARTGGDMEVHGWSHSAADNTWIPGTEKIFGNTVLQTSSRNHTAIASSATGASEAHEPISKSGFIKQDESYFALPEKSAQDVSRRANISARKAPSKTGSAQRTVQPTQKLSVRGELKEKSKANS